jgi:hypothetical protein
MVGAGGELNVDGAGGVFPGEFGLHGAAGTLEGGARVAGGVDGNDEGLGGVAGGPEYESGSVGAQFHEWLVENPILRES